MTFTLNYEGDDTDDLLQTILGRVAQYHGVVTLELRTDAGDPSGIDQMVEVLGVTETTATVEHWSDDPSDAPSGAFTIDLSRICELTVN